MARSKNENWRGDSHNANPWRAYTDQEIQEWRRNLAKEANQRIRELRATKDPTTNRTYTRSGDNAYSIMVKSYLGKSKKGVFSEAKNRKLSKEGLRHEIEVLQGFLNAQTSTVQGIETQRRRREQTLKERYGISEETARNPKFYDFLNSETFKQAVKLYGDSGDILDMVFSDNGAKLSPEQAESMFKEWLGEDRPSKKNLKMLVDRYSKEQRGDKK